MNLPNKITIFRILLIPFFISFILYSKWEIALIIFIIAAISDGLDGYLARTLKQRTELGRILDPIADKMLILSAFISFCVASNLPASVKPPYYVPIVIISREGIIILGALLIYFIKGKIEMKPTGISKITTFLQMITVISILLKLAVSAVLWNVAVAFTIYSGLDYIIKGSRLLND
ncbi:MAG: CDP-diacylglycerol--glycerol-3-phosphate 3-phosphatidyltransferase [Candidatus Omnitrophota bacterium]|nr:MAG: CDP-diacylglycerol--glycerol-3-phosphate 3-phosphatidyltransferase [Candidatus Omnitrophota bacterium]